MFAELPLDNRTVDQFAASGAAISGCLWPLQTSSRPKRLNVSSRLIVL
jgi:hypothetical protein